MCAQVQSVGGHRTGILPGTGHGNDDAPVLVQCFDLSSGRLVSIDPIVKQPRDRHYKRIADPPWARASRSQIDEDKFTQREVNST
jgi:hypothetical protein